MPNNHMKPVNHTMEPVGAGFGGALTRAPGQAGNAPRGGVRSYFDVWPMFTIFTTCKKKIKQTIFF